MNLSALRANKDRVWAWIIGVSIILIAFRNPYAMTIGMTLLVISLLYIFFDKDYRSQLTLGKKYIYIPLIIISLSVIGSGITQYFSNHNFSYLLMTFSMGILFFVLYLVGKRLGKEMFKPFVVIVVLETISILIYSLFLHYAFQNGGIISKSNYNIAVGVLVLGAIVAMVNKRWIIVLIALIGVIFTGAEEGIVAIAILFVAVLIRQDFSKKLFIPIGLGIAIVVLGIYPFSYTKGLYSLPIDKFYVLAFGKHSSLASDAWVLDPENYSSKMDYALDFRVSDSLEPLKPLGYGYVMNPDYNVPHNIPLVIVEQVGIIAGIAWLFLTLFCLIKTKWKYVFVGVIALSLFDHYLWTQWGIFYFSLVGVAVKNDIQGDLIFKA